MIIYRERTTLNCEGIRNAFALAYAGNGDLFGAVNSDDRDDPEELNWLQEGHHDGFPWRIGGNVPARQRSITWDGRDSRGTPVGSGVYFYRLLTGLNLAATKKMIVLR